MPGHATGRCVNIWRDRTRWGCVRSFSVLLPENHFAQRVRFLLLASRRFRPFFCRDLGDRSRVARLPFPCRRSFVRFPTAGRGDFGGEGSGMGPGAKTCYVTTSKGPCDQLVQIIHVGSGKPDVLIRSTCFVVHKLYTRSSCWHFFFLPAFWNSCRCAGLPAVCSLAFVLD